MKKFLIKVMVLCGIVAVFQVFMDSRINKSPLFYSVNEILAEHPDIVFLGDSSIYTSNPTIDKDTSSIAAMSARLSTNISVKEITQAAATQPLFLAVADFLSRQTDKPQAVVLSVNLRSFSVAWANEPGFQFEKERFYFTAPGDFYHFYRPLAAFHWINLRTISPDEFGSLPVYYRDTKIGVVKDFETRPETNIFSDKYIRERYILGYMFNLHSDDKNLRALEKTIDVLKNAGIKIYLYVTPVDFEIGREYIGPDFLVQVRSNTKTICDMAKRKRAPCLDLSLDLPHEDFNSGPDPVEHLYEKGRMYVATRVSDNFIKNLRRYSSVIQ